jgi:hypothetical protein
VQLPAAGLGVKRCVFWFLSDYDRDNTPAGTRENGRLSVGPGHEREEDPGCEEGA